jgi:hypothetical protein
MTKNIFASAILAAVRSGEAFDRTVAQAENCKWSKDQKAMIRIFVTALAQVTAGASVTQVTAALKAGFKDAIQSAPQQESEIKAFRAAVMKALAALDFETATPDSIAECVNGFTTQGQWRAFWRKPQASEEGEEGEESSETTDADRRKAIGAILDGCDDADAVLEGVIADRKA